MMTAFVACLVGVAVGVRHALEPDHLAAISVLATEQTGARSGLLIGSAWGLGHGLVIVVVGGALSLLEWTMPESVALTLEFAIAVMIVGLGISAIRRAVREGFSGPNRPHRHGDVVHAHAASRDHLHLRSLSLATRPLMIGIAHGLAGSGALAALVLAEMPTLTLRLSYVAAFGIGSILGMGLLTAATCHSLGRLTSERRLTRIQIAAGLASIGIGGWWGFVSGTQLLSA